MYTHILACDVKREKANKIRHKTIYLDAFVLSSLSLYFSSTPLFSLNDHEEIWRKKMIESDQTKDFFFHGESNKAMWWLRRVLVKKARQQCVRECRKIVYMISCNAHHIYRIFYRNVKDKLFFIWVIDDLCLLNFLNISFELFLTWL